MNELELKFQVPEAILPSLRAELGRHGARTVRLLAHYYDTDAGHLARDRLSLRLRNEDGKWVQTLKAEGESAVERLEHNVMLRVARAAQPALDPKLHDRSAAGAALRNALAESGASELAERYGTDVRRYVCTLRLQGAEIEAALDEGTIQCGDRTATIRELELEYKSGDRAALFALARAWSTHGGLWLNTLSKAGRGALLARGEAYETPLKAAAPKVHEQMNSGQFVRAVVRSTLDQILANASAIAAGSTREGHVHQLRIGLRRLRTALRELADLDDRIDQGWDEPLSVTFARLGELRDNVAVARTVQPILERAGAPKLRWDVAAVEVDAGATVRNPVFQATLLEVLAFSLQERADGRSVAQLHEYLRTRLKRLHDQVVRAGKDFETLPLPKQHQARKRLKRLRYLAEFVAPLDLGKAGKHYLAHLEPAQDALGKHIDVAVAVEKFRQDAEHDIRSEVAVQCLRAYLGDTARHARAALKEVAAARPFWQG